MPTMQQLERALVNADKAGDVDAARKLVAILKPMRSDPVNQIPTGIAGVTPEKFSQAKRQPEPTLGQQIVGAGETGLALATGATGGAIGMLGGAIRGIGQEVMSGGLGGNSGIAEKSAAQGAQALTYSPRTQAGQSQTKAVGDFLGGAIPPVIPVVGPAGGVAAGISQAVPAAERAVRASQAVVRDRVVPAITEAMKKQSAASRSVGASEIPVALQRTTTAGRMPVPFKGKSALTAGQATRDFSQLQFEKEVSKMGDVGQPMRERGENQTATMIQNFDAMIDKAGPIAVEKRDIGKVVTQAVVNKANALKGKISLAYKEAEAAGEMTAPVEMTALSERLTDLNKFEGVATNIPSIRKEAVRLGAVSVDEAGNLVPGEITLANSELLRQFVNESTDWTNKREALMARRINASIDQATEGKGGEAYKAARKLRSRFSNEFENVGLTARLLGTKKGTTERKIALDDVFDKVILISPIEEINNLRSTLLSAGPDGKQAWTDMKAAGIAHIKDSSLSASQMDSAGNYLLSPDKLNRTVNRLDKEGKLESLYGKKQAQIIRDLAELSTVIYTAPPGAVNHSNTASALQVALDSLGTFAVTGVPAPAATVLKEGAKYMRDRKTKARLQHALDYAKTKETKK